MVAELKTTDDGFSFYTNPKSQEEARFFYREIFHDKSYDVAALPDNAVVVDAGANIGLFSLWLKSRLPRARVLAFEPAPDNCIMFRRNMQLHDVSGVDLYQYALGRKSYNRELTFFRTLQGNSTLYPEQKIDALDPLLPPDHPLREAWTEDIERSPWRGDHSLGF